MTYCTCCGEHCPGGGEFIRGHAPRLKGLLVRWDRGIDRTPIPVWNPETGEMHLLSPAEVITLLESRGWRDSTERRIDLAARHRDRELRRARGRSSHAGADISPLDRLATIERMKLAARLVKESGERIQVTKINCEELISQLTRGK